MTEKRFHPFAVLHLLRKTILVYLLPLVQVLFIQPERPVGGAGAGCAAALLSMVCWEGAACQRLADGRPRQPALVRAGGWASGWTAPCGRTCWLP